MLKTDQPKKPSEKIRRRLREKFPTGLVPNVSVIWPPPTIEEILRVLDELDERLKKLEKENA